MRRQEATALSEMSFVQGVSILSLMMIFDFFFFFLGGTIQGLISDVLQKRAPVLAISLLFAVGSLFGYSREYAFAVQ